MRKGTWSEQEDELLRKCVEKYGQGEWHRVPSRAGLNRCRKSCRLRWFNYLSPNIKRGKFSDDEIDMIIRLHNLLGNRWTLIAGRIPGRTANDVKNYWNTNVVRKTTRVSEDHRHTRKRMIKSSSPKTKKDIIIKPRPRTISKNFNNPLVGLSEPNNKNPAVDQDNLVEGRQYQPVMSPENDDAWSWWQSLMMRSYEGKETAEGSGVANEEPLPTTLWGEDVIGETVGGGVGSVDIIDFWRVLFADQEEAGDSIAYI